MSKQQKDPIVKVGGNPKDLLRERGVEYDGSSFMPEVPDLLGYLLGLMLFWLIYTGYQSVIGMVSSPDSTVSRIGAKAEALKARAVEAGRKAEDRVESIVGAKALQALQEDVLNVTSPTRGRLADRDVPTDPEGGWFSQQLARFNNGVTKVISATKEWVYADSLTDGAESGIESSEQSSPRRPVREDTLEWF